MSLICANCGRGKSKDKVKLICRDGMSVALCDDDARDWFAREKAFCRARGEVWDAGKAGAAK